MPSYTKRTKPAKIVWWLLENVDKWWWVAFVSRDHPLSRGTLWGVRTFPGIRKLIFLKNGKDIFNFCGYAPGSPVGDIAAVGEKNLSTLIDEPWFKEYLIAKQESASFDEELDAALELYRAVNKSENLKLTSKIKRRKEQYNYQ